jgi:hypothetical protein
MTLLIFYKLLKNSDSYEHKNKLARRGHISYPLVCRRPGETVSPKGDKYVIDEELQHTDHLFLGVASFTFLNFV